MALPAMRMGRFSKDNVTSRTKARSEVIIEGNYNGGQEAKCP